MLTPFEEKSKIKYYWFLRNYASGLPMRLIYSWKSNQSGSYSASADYDGKPPCLNNTALFLLMTIWPMVQWKYLSLSWLSWSDWLSLLVLHRFHYITILRLLNLLFSSTKPLSLLTLISLTVIFPLIVTESIYTYQSVIMLPLPVNAVFYRLHFSP